MSLLEVRNLSHVFPDGTVAVKDVSLSVQAGDFVVLAGANGSGKTVLIRHFNGLLLPTKGSVLLEGEPISRDLIGVRKSIGLVFQNSDSQIVGQTVAEEVAFGPENLNLPRAEVERRVEESLEAVGLGECQHQAPHRLSGGQKRRLAIAGVLAMGSRVIVLDEPFSGLDYPGTVQVLEHIVALHQRGTTIILVTHELEKVLAHADRLILMEKGRIMQDGKPDEVIETVEAYGVKSPFGVGRSIRTMTWLS